MFRDKRHSSRSSSNSNRKTFSWFRNERAKENEERTENERTMEKWSCDKSLQPETSEENETQKALRMNGIWQNEGERKNDKNYTAKKGENRQCFCDVHFVCAPLFGIFDSLRRRNISLCRILWFIFAFTSMLLLLNVDSFDFVHLMDKIHFVLFRFICDFSFHSFSRCLVQLIILR